MESKKVSPLANDTANRALDAAERLVQTMGFNWFSYADIAIELGIRKASLHHHFATKGDLGCALIRRYIERFRVELEALNAERSGAPRKLARYAQLYEDVLRGKRLCLCGMLAAEYASLPQLMQAEIRRFFDLNQIWITSVIEEGRRSRHFHSRGSASAVASMVLSGLEGAMLIARPYDDVARFSASAAQVLSSLNASPRAAPHRRVQGARASALTNVRRIR